MPAFIKYQASGEKLLLTLWVGSMWFAGYVVAPVLFNMLDRTTAGNVAGQIFTISSYIGLVAGGFLLLSVLLNVDAENRFGMRFRILVVMLVIIIIGQFVLQPMMAELKQGGLVKGSQSAIEFGRLHGVSSILFLVNSISGLWLVLIGVRPSR